MRGQPRFGNKSRAPLPRPPGAVIPINGVAIGTDRAVYLGAIPSGGKVPAAIGVTTAGLPAFIGEIQVPLALANVATVRAIAVAVPGAVDVRIMRTTSSTTAGATSPVGSVRPVDTSCIGTERALHEAPLIRHDRIVSHAHVMATRSVAVFVGQIEERAI